MSLQQGVTDSKSNIIAGTEETEQFWLGNYRKYLNTAIKEASIYGMGGGDLFDAQNLFLLGTIERVIFHGSFSNRYQVDVFYGRTGGTTEAYGGSGYDLFSSDEYTLESTGLSIYEDRIELTANDQSKTKYIIHSDVEEVYAGGTYLMSDLLRGVARKVDSEESQAYRNAWHESNPAKTTASSDEMPPSGATNESSNETLPNGTATESDQTIETIQVDLSSILTGKSTKKDVVTGTDEDDTIGAGKGADELRGMGGADYFVFNQKDKFGAKGADNITDFDSDEGDVIALNAKALPGLTSAELGVATNKSELESLYSSTVNIIYYQPTGQLIYDQNGSGKGFGKGGIFAILAGSPELSAYDFGIF
jgi:Ca2+-binding RTX toxin-like protein